MPYVNVPNDLSKMRLQQAKKQTPRRGPAAKGKKRAALSAQQTIPYVRMLPDGVCQLPGGLYTKTVEYEDINYSVASTEDQTAIFSGWSSFLNYFDSSLPFQLSFINRRSHSRSRYKVNIPQAEDDFNSVRAEFTGMLKNQIARSNNGIERSKYITFGIPAESLDEARPRLERVEADVMSNFKRLGVPSEPMDGRARLALLHGQMHPGSREPFRFSWGDIAKTGLGTKDFIAPDSFDFRQPRLFRMGQYWGAASYLQILASELSDKLLAEILELDAEMTVTLHIQTVDQLKAIKTIKGKISDIGKMKVEEQRKAVRAGYDPDILPPDLITFSKDAAELLADLQSRNERMFLLTFTVVNLAPTRQRLENDIFTVGGIAQKYNCTLKRLDWQQEQGFVSSLALGGNEVEIQRGMTTSSTAIFIPFMTRELRMAGPSLYYGMNALSHNVIMADRKKLKSANGLYLGSTGSGKSFAAKRELLNVFLTIPQDRIIIVDPMGEYAPLVRRLGGQVIEIAPDSPNHINPMDIQMGGNDEDSPLSMKADFLLSLCELVVGGKEGLQPIEKTVIDRCVRLVYRDLALGVGDGRMPLLQDLYEELLKQPEPEARRVATALELYCTGSLNLFNHPTNVKTDCRVVCIVLKGMGDNLRKIAMHVTNEFVNSSVNTNYQSGISTWCYFDEFHVLLRDQLTASYFVSIWQMLRKRGCVPSALTQNVKHLLASPEIQNILDNTDFMILLSQAQSDRAILAKQLGISEHQLSYITHSNSGEGLLFYGNVTIPFMDRFPRGEIYDLLTTRPEDLKDGAAG
jgi:type IV secretory pathway VirB4 component